MARDYRLKELLPDFPRTPHLPINPNIGEGDVVAGQQAVEDMYDASTVWIEEKVDGANVGISYWKGQFLCRNRRESLRKGQLPKNPSGQQFKPLWNWLYEHQGNFQLLHRLLEFDPDEPISIYGEWLWMAHGIHYTSLSSFFMAFDLYDPTKGTFITDRKTARDLMRSAGFEIPELLYCGNLQRLHDGTINPHYINHLMQRGTKLAEVKPVIQEGIYIRFDHYHTGEPKRYKMVRSDFERGKFWREDEIIRNLLRKK